MTATEFAEMIAYLEERWGTLHRGWVGRETILYADFAQYSNTVATEALRELFHAGSNSCPSPSKVVAQLRSKTSAKRPIVGERNCDGKHTWAFDEIEDGKRAATCVGCGEEAVFAADQLRTPGEQAEGPAAAPTHDAPY